MWSGCSTLDHLWPFHQNHHCSQQTGSATWTSRVGNWQEYGRRTCWARSLSSFFLHQPWEWWKCRFLAWACSWASRRGRDASCIPRASVSTSIRKDCVAGTFFWILENDQLLPKPMKAKRNRGHMYIGLVCHCVSNAQYSTRGGFLSTWMSSDQEEISH